MHEVSREILAHHQVRKTRAQKAAFRRFLRDRLEAQGYTVREEVSPWIKSTNVVVGDVNRADVVFTAHYDTCARLPLPNFLAPRNILVSLLYQLLLAAVIFALVFAVVFLLMWLAPGTLWASAAPLAVLLLVMGLMLFGPANPHTANDNTSGVVTLVEALLTLPEDMHARAAFVFFDNEELGLLGSANFAKRHRGRMAHVPLINLDCVSDGDHLLVVAGKALRRDAAWMGRIDTALTPPAGKTKALVPSSRALYPSDQAHFPKGAAIVALRHSRLVGHYVSRIHTARDTVFDEANIETLRRFAVALVAG